MKATPLLIAAAACLLASCKESTTPAATTSETGKESSGSEAVKSVLATAPKGEAVAISTTRESAKPGEEVTIKGRIMGNATPFVAGRSAFILADTSILHACSDTPGDSCSTPWDACCNSPEEKKKGTATIQIVDGDGRVLKEPLEGVGGLNKLTSITVSGKVAAGSSADVLIVNATAIQTEK